jgi:hypothetical protein
VADGEEEVFPVSPASGSGPAATSPLSGTGSATGEAGPASPNADSKDLKSVRDFKTISMGKSSANLALGRSSSILPGMGSPRQSLGMLSISGAPGMGKTTAQLLSALGKSSASLSLSPGGSKSKSILEAHGALWEQLRQTEVIKNNATPAWEPVVFKPKYLGFTGQEVILVRCWDWNRNGNHTLIGEAFTTVNALRTEGSVFPLVNEDERKKSPTTYTDSGRVIVSTVKTINAHPGTSLPCSSRCFLLC